MFRTKTFTPFLVPATLVLLVSLTGCRDEDYKRNEEPNKKDRTTTSPRLEDKADRLEDKAERHQDKAERLENKADETRDTTRPGMDRIDEGVDSMGNENR
jgi:hypothetical protein